MLLLAVTSEKGASVTISFVRRADDTSEAVVPITDTLVGTGVAQSWTRALDTGTYEVTTAALDAAGNQTHQTRTVTATKPATAGEIAAGIGLLLVLLGLFVGLVVVLWRKRHWIAATAERRRAAATSRSHQAVVAAAQAEYTSARAAHEEAMAGFHEADRGWKARQAQLTELI